jgi:hypothetical protein
MNISGDYFAIYLVKKLKTVNFQRYKMDRKVIQDICYNNAKEYFGWKNIDEVVHKTVKA